MDSVERGAALLDERVPGWYEKIDLATLDVSQTCGCVLGQVFAPTTSRQMASYGFARGLKALGINMGDTCRKYGFDVARIGPYRYGTYESLTARWKRLIRRRLKAQA